MAMTYDKTLTEIRTKLNGLERALAEARALVAKRRGR